MSGLARPQPSLAPDAPAAPSPEAGRWEGLVRWGARFYATRDFGTTELDDTLRVSERLRRARGALLAGSASWATLLERAFGAPNDLTDLPAQGRFLTWCAGHPEAARGTLEAIWREAPHVTPGERVRAAPRRRGAQRAPGGAPQPGLLPPDGPRPHPLPGVRRPRLRPRLRPHRGAPTPRGGGRGGGLRARPGLPRPPDRRRAGRGWGRERVEGRGGEPGPRPPPQRPGRSALRHPGRGPSLLV